jgi:Na+-driven multidrug efflux pump
VVYVIFDVACIGAAIIISQYIGAGMKTTASRVANSAFTKLGKSDNKWSE